MNRDELIALWKHEESIARMHGWDFSHINDRYSEEDDFPWNYRSVIQEYLNPEMKLLDTDTGGGEFLLSLGHPYGNTAATEAWPPNIELCGKVLIPLGIDFRPGSASDILPFDDESFDIIINRHGDFNPADLFRLLKPGGIFITQQVGAENDRELVRLLLGDTPLPFPKQYLSIAEDSFRKAGFEILRSDECFRRIRFSDVGALVWFARIIEWEFPGFSADNSIDNLLKAQEILEKTGCIEGRTHRFMLAAQKPLS
ncbi:MAG: class I SAM-dependent methyltransferase [Clostridia bacterium]|nr:class I SAM-dependent methyltransferase [Clostridia bacterium]